LSLKKDKQAENMAKMKPKFLVAVHVHFLHSPSFNLVACAEALFGGHLVAMDSATAICPLPMEGEENPPSVLLCKGGAFLISEDAFKKCFKAHTDEDVMEKFEVIVAFNAAASCLINDLKFDPTRSPSS